MLIGVLSINERGQIGDEMYKMDKDEACPSSHKRIFDYSTVLDIESRHH